jgi:Fe-S oxidoreductase
MVELGNVNSRIRSSSSNPLSTGITQSNNECPMKSGWWYPVNPHDPCDTRIILKSVVVNSVNKLGGSEPAVCGEGIRACGGGGAFW